MSRLRAYAQLVRLPNVFTAFADIALGALAVWGVGRAAPAAGWWLSFAALLAASGCLYSAGMVWNDFFDFEQDRGERPFRPIPSRRVTRRAAAWLGTVLLGAGLLFAAAAGWRGTAWDRTPLLLGGILAAAILLYDGWLKRTGAGPLGMGTCRFLNVMLGLTVGGVVGPSWNWEWHLAAVVGVY